MLASRGDITAPVLVRSIRWGYFWFATMPAWVVLAIALLAWRAAGLLGYLPQEGDPGLQFRLPGDLLPAAVYLLTLFVLWPGALFSLLIFPFLSIWCARTRVVARRTQVLGCACFLLALLLFRLDPLGLEQWFFD